MPKKQNITDIQIAKAVAGSDDLFFELQEIAEEVRAGRCDEMTNTAERIRSLVDLARIAADAAGALMTRQAMHDDREALRKELEARLTTHA